MRSAAVKRRGLSVLAGHIARLDHVCVCVRDVDASIEWYRAVLGMSHQYSDHPSFGTSPAFLRCGRSGASVALLALEAEKAPVPQHNGAHFALGLHSEEAFEAAVAELPALLLRHGGDTASTAEPHIDVQDYGLQRSVFFADLDANIVELTWWRDIECSA